MRKYTGYKTKDARLCMIARFCFVLSWVLYIGLTVHVHADESQENRSDEKEIAAYIDGDRDLSELIGREFEDARTSLGCAEPFFAMSFQYAVKDSVTLGRMVSGSTISYICLSNETASTQYSLCDITLGASVEDAEYKLVEDGYMELKPGFVTAENVIVFYNPDLDCFLQLGWDETGNSVESLTLTVCSRGIHTDKTDIYLCYGLTAEEVMESIGDLSLRLEGNEVYLEKSGVVFSGLADNDDLLNSVISEIMITGTDGDYSIYGVCPGDLPEDIEQTGFDGGGSGELIDPAGRVLTFLYSTDENEPRIALS